MLERSSTVIVHPFASRRMLVERCTPLLDAVVLARLVPLLDELTDTELLDEFEPCALDEADAAPSVTLTVVSITRPSAV